MDGIVVSNHGGRQVDGAIATMDALPAVLDAVAGACRSSSTAASAPARTSSGRSRSGRAAVGLGRPYVWGLAAGGEEGVREVIRNYRADFDLTLGLAGMTSARELGRENVTRA